MEAAEQLREDVLAGRINVDRLVELIVVQQRQLQAANASLQAALARVAELEKQLGDRVPPAKLEEPFSMRAEQKRQEARGQAPKKGPRKHRRGRVATAEKLALAERSEDVYPEGIEPARCQFSHARPVWRLEGGRAVLVAYRVFRGPGNRYGRIPGVIGRSEYGREIAVAIAYLVQVLGLSFDKVALLLQFFQNLAVRKSQADALLSQLARSWQDEFEDLCTLLANALVVNADETGWSISSVWAFLSENARLVLYGVPKDAETLAKVLDPATFGGLGISDDAAVYARFTNAQKCWAHLLRKAVKLTLQDPGNATYRDFADRLLQIYRDACAAACAGVPDGPKRKRAVAELEDRVIDLCNPIYLAELPKTSGPADDYRLLNEEIMRLALAEQLFPFVTAAPAVQPNGEVKPAGGTNNEAERTLRNPAEARKAHRASKTPAGARRQTILKSVLESLRLYLARYTLRHVIDEVQGWVETGQSCFGKLLKKLKIPRPEGSVLDRLFPKAPAPEPQGA